MKEGWAPRRFDIEVGLGLDELDGLHHFFGQDFDREVEILKLATQKDFDRGDMLLLKLENGLTFFGGDFMFHLEVSQKVFEFTHTPKITTNKKRARSRSSPPEDF